MSTDVRTLLHDLAAEAPRGRGEETADLVVDLHRAQDRRRLRWAGVAAVIALVVAVVPALVDRSGPTDAAAVAATGDGGAAPMGLYDVGTRGSLAGDAALVEQARTASWDDGVDNPDGDVDPTLDARRVLFMGSVPGSQVWALVMGQVDGQLWYLWLVDVDPTDGVDLARAWGPDKAFPDTPMGLMDVAGDVAPLVVVASPGDEVQFAPDGGGNASGADPTWVSLTTDDGIAVADVPVDLAGRFPGYRVLRDGHVVYRPTLQQFDSTLPLGPDPVFTPPPGAPDAAEFGQRMADCLIGQGYQVTPQGDSYSYDTTDSAIAGFRESETYCLSATGYDE